MESREPALERHVRRPGAADEAHRAWASAVVVHRLVLGSPNFRVERQTEIAVGVHAQKRLRAVAVEQIAWALALGRWHNAGNDGFLALEATRMAKLR